MALIGRQRECQMLDRLLAGAREGMSGVLVLRGDPGVGKTALAEYAAASAEGFRIVRAVGVESEAELAFAALHQLCQPLEDGIVRLPEPQRDALLTAFGLSTGSAPEGLLVGLATLSLLSAAAAEQPLLCVIDDAQWLDRASAQTAAFVARRLLAEPVAMVFATREWNGALMGLPDLVVEGLSADDARSLLSSTLQGPLDDRVGDRIIAETQGNPLALLELPKAASGAELAFGTSGHDGKPLSGRIEESFIRRIDALPPETRTLLLVASADALGDPSTVLRAAESLGVDASAVEPAADAELLAIDRRVHFRHPLVRSAVYRTATSSARRDAHRALAEATDREREPDRRAWHLAAATIGFDDSLAGELEHSAGRAQVRGGPAAAAAFLERAAELTTDPQQRALRLLQAAAAQLTAGANDRAHELLLASTADLVDPIAQAGAMRLDGAIRFADGRGGETPELLYDAAVALAAFDVSLARESMVDAFEAAMWAGELTAKTTVFDVVDAARAMPPIEPDESIPSNLLAGYTERLTASYAAALRPWRRAADANTEEMARQPNVKWQGMVWNFLGEMLDFERHLAVGRERVRIAREQGALTDLPIALSCLAWNEIQAGRVDVAEGMVAEAIGIAAATGNPSMPGAQELMLVATLVWRGREEDARRYIEALKSEAAARAQGLSVDLADFQLTLLELSLGRYDAARVVAQRLYAHDPMYVGTMGLADAVEAMVRSDDAEGARRALARLDERATASGTPWGLGLLARARAQLTADSDAEALYVEAVDQLARSGNVIDLARAHLLFGEWLRRLRRRRDAREQLRLAHELFEATGTRLWAERARTELLATGEHARMRDPSTADELTPQEQQVARLAAGGESNAEIGAQLFISPHTVAYHLRKVYTKLGVSSRTQLSRTIGGDLVAAVGR